MKKLLLFCSVALLSSGCIEVKEVLKVTRKGKGYYKLSYDLSKLLKNDTYNNMILMIKRLGVDDNTSLPDISSMILDEIEEIDTVYSNLEIGLSDEYSYIMKNVEIELIAKKEEQKLYASVLKRFSDMDELNHFLINFDEIIKGISSRTESLNSDNEVIRMLNSLPSPFSFSLDRQKLFDFKRGELTRYRSPELGQAFLNVDGKPFSRFEFSVLGNPTYRTRYELPKKVKSVSNERAHVSKKTVFIEHGFSNLGSNNKSFNVVISY